MEDGGYLRYSGGPGALRSDRTVKQEVHMRRTFVTAGAIIGLLLATCAAAGATGALKGKSKTRPFSEVEAGVMLSATGLRFEDVYRIKRSPDGGGAAIRDGLYLGTTFPVSGVDTVISNFKDGRSTASETFTLGAPSLEGIGPISGHGRCTGGSDVHQGEKCSYSFRGTYDLLTSNYNITLSGSDTRMSNSK